MSRILMPLLDLSGDRYGFHDGIVDSICPENGDPTWSVNVKRGIISALQNSMDRIDLDYNDVEVNIAIIEAYLMLVLFTFSVF